MVCTFIINIFYKDKFYGTTSVEAGSYFSKSIFCGEVFPDRCCNRRWNNRLSVIVSIFYYRFILYPENNDRLIGIPETPGESPFGGDSPGVSGA